MEGRSSTGKQKEQHIPSSMDPPIPDDPWAEPLSSSRHLASGIDCSDRNGIEKLRARPLAREQDQRTTRRDEQE